MRMLFSEKFDKHLGEEFRFFKSWISSPKAMGAILPTSAFTARKMASLIDLGPNNIVLELGPGTGSITRAIIERGVTPENLYSVEYNEEFLEDLRKSLPKVNFLHGNAFELDDVLPDLEGKKFDTIVSAIPMLCFSEKKRIELLNSLLKRLNPGRPVIQISYGAKSPIPASFGDYSVEHFDWSMRNIPPARLWVYRKIFST